jgi:hypothetical protein
MKRKTNRARKTRAKTLKLRDVEVLLETDPDSVELIPQWFDDAQKAKLVAERVEAGDPWAWSTVIMRLSYKGLVSRPAAMPGCSFRDEREFRQSAYFAQMVQECLEDLIERLQPFGGETVRASSKRNAKT